MHSQLRAEFFDNDCRKIYPYSIDRLQGACTGPSDWNTMAMISTTGWALDIISCCYSGSSQHIIDIEVSISCQGGYYSGTQVIPKPL